MEELLKKREEIKKQIDEMITHISILKEQKQEIEAEILPQLKTKDGAKLTMRYEDKTVSIGSRKGIKIINEKVASLIIPESERESYFRLDKLMFANLAKDYIAAKGEVPLGLEVIQQEYLLVKEVKKPIKQTNK